MLGDQVGINLNKVAYTIEVNNIVAIKGNEMGMVLGNSHIRDWSLESMVVESVATAG